MPETRQYRVVVWCKDCGEGEDPAGCFDGGEGCVEDDEGDSVFYNITAAEKAGWKETEEPPWDYRIERKGDDGEWRKIEVMAEIEELELRIAELTDVCVNDSCRAHATGRLLDKALEVLVGAGVEPCPDDTYFSRMSIMDALVTIVPEIPIRQLHDAVSEVVYELQKLMEEKEDEKPRS